MYSSTGNNPDEFIIKLNEYIITAKEISKKQIEKDDKNKLVNQVLLIINLLKKKHLIEKFGCDNISLRYLDGTEFPNTENHKNNNIYDDRIVRFIIAISILYKNLTKEIIQKIIQKSPLELVNLLKEINVFLNFVSANPKDYGHGIFSERKDDIIIVYSTNDAILRILKPIIYKLLITNQHPIYKLSRVTTTLCNECKNMNNILNSNLKFSSIINNLLQNMKRNTSDDTRIAIFNNNN